MPVSEICRTLGVGRTSLYRLVKTAEMGSETVKLP
jgi:hypothetical protein